MTAPVAGLWFRVLVALLVLLAGAASGLATALVHRDWYGLLLAVGVAVAVPLALPGAWWGRAAFGIGWVLAVLTTLVPPAGGGFLVVGDLLGYAMLGGSLALFGTCVATSRTGRRTVRVGPAS